MMRSLRSFEVLPFPGLISKQAGTVHTQELKAKMDTHKEKTEAAIHSIRSGLEETIKHRVEDVLLCVNQEMQVLRQELAENVDEIRVDLQAVKTSLDTRKNSLQETLAVTRNNLHEELGLRLQVHADTMKAEIRINQERLEAKIETTRRKIYTQLKGVAARSERGRGKRTRRPQRSHLHSTGLHHGPCSGVSSRP
jgi:hypothetical protein